MAPHLVNASRSGDLTDPRAVLEELIRADGFDTGCGVYTVEQWHRLVSTLRASLTSAPRERCWKLGVGPARS